MILCYVIKGVIVNLLSPDIKAKILLADGSCMNCDHSISTLTGHILGTDQKVLLGCDHIDRLHGNYEEVLQDDDGVCVHWEMRFGELRTFDARQ